jgi:hypothetical protein
MTWIAKNVSLFPFIIDNTNLHFHEQELQIARVFFDDSVLINAFAESRIKINAGISKDIFETFAKNLIDQYSFDLRGTVEAKFLLFLTKELRIAQHIPIDISFLLKNFLEDSFKRAIFIEQILLTETHVECIVSFLNRPGFPMYIANFDGNIQIGRTNSGRSDFFGPIFLEQNQQRNTTRIRFTRENTILDGSFNQRFFIEGNLTVILWGAEYVFPIRLVEEL